MSTELTVPERREMSLIEVISVAASDPNIDPTKMAQIVDLQMRIQEKQAEIAFNEAMSRLQPKLPRIEKNGVIGINSTTKTKYAKYEDIDVAIRPLLAEEGFSISYRTAFVEGKLIVNGILRHRMGHKEECSIPLPVDASGAKNATQGMGSTLSYGKRYTLCALLNIVTVDEDNDGNGATAEPITDDQVAHIENLVQDTGADLRRFLKYMGVERLADIRTTDYRKAVDALQRKAQR